MKEVTRIPSHSSLLVQCSVGSLIFCLVLPVVCLADKAKRAENQRRAVKAIKGLGGAVYYDNEFRYVKITRDDTALIMGVGSYCLVALNGGIHAVANKGLEIADVQPDAYGHEVLVSALKTGQGTIMLWDDEQQLHVVKLKIRKQGDPERASALSSPLSANQVTAVTLSGTNTTDEDVSVLSALPALRILSLSGTTISDRGVLELRSLSKLQWLNLEGTKITDPGLRPRRARTMGKTGKIGNCASLAFCVYISPCRTILELHGGKWHGYGKVR